jgi:hypothetical protein
VLRAYPPPLSPQAAGGAALAPESRALGPDLVALGLVPWWRGGRGPSSARQPQATPPATSSSGVGAILRTTYYVLLRNTTHVTTCYVLAYGVRCPSAKKGPPCPAFPLRTHPGHQLVNLRPSKAPNIATVGLGFLGAWALGAGVASSQPAMKSAPFLC